MDSTGFERRVAIAARLMTFLAVLASTIGAGLMIVIGLQETVWAIQLQVAGEGDVLPAGDATAIHLVTALDRFLMAVVLLYFAYGIYLLFVRPERSSVEMGIPRWLHVEGIDQLKQTLAEVIIVILFVLFLRVALETFIAQGPDMSWSEMLKLLTLPVSIFLLAAALKLAELHPKPRTAARPPGLDGGQGGSAPPSPGGQSRSPDSQ
ncbi:hypothetical protein CCR85_10840 [Rhodothalassium salexigens]|uniref:YqhA family protein n=1 Tax=Rhodothalassium salexigens TaxID=1086 RepID=UPI0019113D63|nr:YqhA family protein [Rhodothalassium salexigens]MBK5911985.1 hypothetical protein [Rhodothalassium salexigens]